MPRPIGRLLAREWGLKVSHALFDKDGMWYHQLKRFPGALLDPDGYVVFETRESFEGCRKLDIKKDIHVDGHLSEIPGYVRVPADQAYRGQYG